MSKVVLSNGHEFELANDIYNVDNGSCSFTFISDGYTLEEIETIFTGVELFKVVSGDTNVSNLYGYTRVDVLSKFPDYYLGVDSDGTAMYRPVTSVTCSKASVDTRISDIEESIYDIIESILGGDDLLAGLEEEAPADGE